MIINITIGQDKENDIVINDNSVSNFHLEAVYNYNDHSCFISDLESTNGTYVNHRKINKTRIDNKDQLVIGAKLIDIDHLLNEIKTVYYKRKIDFSTQFEYIISAMDEYQTEKLKIQKPALLPNLLRIGLSLVLIIVLIFFPDVIPNPNLRYVLMVGIGLVPMIIGSLFNKNHKKREQQDLLLLKYEDKIKCPKCHYPLLKYSSLYMRQKDKCPNPKCNVVYHLT